MRERATAAALRAVPAVLNGVIEQAKSGHHLPAKLIFKIAGLSEPLWEGPAAGSGNGATLAALLLGQLEAESSGDGNPAGPLAGEKVSTAEQPDTNRAP